MPFEIEVGIGVNLDCDLCKNHVSFDPSKGDGEGHHEDLCTHNYIIIEGMTSMGGKWDQPVANHEQSAAIYGCYCGQYAIDRSVGLADHNVICNRCLRRLQTAGLARHIWTRLTSQS